MTKILMKTKKLPGKNSKKIIDLDKLYISPSYTRDEQYPLTIKKAKGMWITDFDDNTFLDFTAGIAVCATGHCHPKIVSAICKQAKTLIHMSGTDFYYESQGLLAKKLNDLTPGPSRKNVFFANSGTEANEAAIKLAKAHTKRTQFIAFLGSFHGRTVGSLSLSGSKIIHKQDMLPLMPGVTHVPYPYCYRCPFNQNPKTCSIDCASYIENRILGSLIPPDDVAGIFIETIQGEGGYVPAPQKFLVELRRITKKHGILYIDDEIQSGIGRTGKMWATEHFGIVPDIITAAKGIASGLPLGAMIASSDIMDWKPGMHASTFGGNPIACSTALVTLDLVKKTLMKNAEKVGGYIKSELIKMMPNHRLIGDIRGMGLMIGIECVKDKHTKQIATKERNEIIYECVRRGLLALPCGKNTIRFCPPLIVTKKEADMALDVFEGVLSHIEKKKFD